MIRIFKDNDVKVVTQGVYKNLYKPLGYQPVIEIKPEVKAEVKPEVKVVVKEEVTVKPNENKESSKTTKKKKGE